MTIGVYIDNNVWDFLLSEGLELAAELPVSEFNVFITREGEIEIVNMPLEKQEFVARTIVDNGIKTDAFFGFSNPGLSQSEQRVAGFNQGRFASAEEIAYIAEQRHRVKPTSRPRALLAKNEGDLALAVRSMRSIVFTKERPNKNGPLKTAAERGGKVLYVDDYLASGMTLADFIRSRA
ncbi:hypothetical protein ACQZ4Y_20135 [Rhizobium sp. L80/93]|uniref:hypothetical protein n=1 Tax=Rhizobium sp. E27B/91 TaxID=2819995 RepID=UPI001ADA0934|nr:hypothetical protein [Rhizobium sp. E27B/91]MBO9186806.1 hypothetical protein [Rhizobium sp. E27B/91]